MIRYPLFLLYSLFCEPWWWCYIIVASASPGKDNDCVEIWLGILKRETEREGGRGEGGRYKQRQTDRKRQGKTGREKQRQKYKDIERTRET